MNPIFKIVIGVGVVLGLAVAYWLGSPLFLNKKVSEAPIVVTESTEVIAQGNFMDADSFHKVRGTAKLIKTGDKYIVRFEDDFNATNGPDLFVYFGRDGEYVDEARIAALKGNIGSQNYDVPENINPLEYTEIWIWCRAFSVLFGNAVLEAI